MNVTEFAFISSRLCGLKLPRGATVRSEHGARIRLAARLRLNDRSRRERTFERGARKNFNWSTADTAVLGLRMAAIPVSRLRSCRSGLSLISVIRGGLPTQRPDGPSGLR